MDEAGKKAEKNERRRQAYASMDAAKKCELLKRRRLKYVQSRNGPAATTRPTCPTDCALPVGGCMFEVGESSATATSDAPAAAAQCMVDSVVDDQLFHSGFRRTPAHINHDVYPSKRSGNSTSDENCTVVSAPSPSAQTSYVLSPEVADCCYCSAKRFFREPPSFCCSEGEIRLVPSRMPDELFHLFTSPEPESVEFRKYVRTYNNHLAFTTFGAKTDPDLMKNTKGIYTFSVQGKVHHFLNCLQSCDEPPRNLQLYFYDGDSTLDHRLALSTRLSKGILTKLLRILDRNPYVHFLRQLKDLDDMCSHRICLVNSPKLDQRVFNEPACEDVSAILALENDADFDPHCHIQVYERDALPYRISHNYACFDSLQYPLFFPNGDCGWHFGIQKLPPNSRKRWYTSNTFAAPLLTGISSAGDLVRQEEEVLVQGSRKHNIVSCRQYYCYKLQMRDSDRSGLLHGGRLLQQYVVDMFVKVETSRLEYLKKQQREIRTEFLQGIVDSISNGNISGSSVGRKVILPPSFMGGPRDMRKRYMDAMALVQQFGKPDYFITMTCNPSWIEITRHLLPGELPQNRPDLLSRVFKVKLEMLKKDLLTNHLFGMPSASVYSVEFQKRGLPHVHLLLVLDRDSKPVNPEAYDRYISAELAHPHRDPELYSLVTKHMIHGPCGSLNTKSPCMRSKQCKNKYPRSYLDHTTHGEDSYPLYRRRDSGVSARVRGQKVDNRWVVPYNPYLLRKYDCHINVEVCSTIKLVKYLYKYIYKGPDKIAFQLSNTTSENEIVDYQKGRWVSPPEATWRLHSFPLFEIHPSVIALQVHLPNNYPISFRADQDLATIVANEFLGRTMLTQFFYMNNHNERARHLKCLYKDFPRYFVWDGGKRYWAERKRGTVVGRVVSVGPTEGERYYLRLLLNNIKGPTSFDNLLTFKGHMYPTFRDSALQRGLLATDIDLHKCLDEAVSYQMPRQLRHLFATILVFCSPSDPRRLWEKYSGSLCEDYMRLRSGTYDHVSDIRKKGLHDLMYLLDDLGRSLSQYDLGPEADFVSQHLNLAREIEHERAILVDEGDLVNLMKLNPQQLSAYNAIMEKITKNEPATFFVDGPGGTGKTFLYKTILAALRSHGHIAIATATSGVAASVLPGGRTAHSRFKLPLHSEESRSTNVSRQSALARLLREAKVIIWDEAPMAHRKSIEAFSEMLRDVTQVDSPFGDKVVVFGGDFRQVLPVVTNATRTEQIDACLISSPLWPSFTKFQLSHNMRSFDDPPFSKFLLRIGDGTAMEDDDGHITLPANIVIPFLDKESSLNSLIDFVYPDISLFSSDPTSIINRALLAPTNNCVDDINECMLLKMSGEVYTYSSTDVALNIHQQGDYEDFLNTLNPSSLPPHKLQLKLNCPVIMLRNLNPTEGLCNGTRLICKELRSHTIVAEIVTGPNTGELTIIHKIPLEASNEDKKSGIPFKRYQFPIRLCFAMTINKAQGQTLDRVGIYLREPVFSHGQLYVALSRARKSSAVRVLITPPTLGESAFTNKTKNTVYREILRQ